VPTLRLAGDGRHRRDLPGLPDHRADRRCAGRRPAASPARQAAASTTGRGRPPQHLAGAAQALFPPQEQDGEEGEDGEDGSQGGHVLLRAALGYVHR
jgi:hypothetical protein